MVPIDYAQGEDYLTVTFTILFCTGNTGNKFLVLFLI